MSYMDIDNLYKNQDILLFKECYAMEKIHGSSAHIGWNGQTVFFFSGGTDHNAFVSLFDKDNLHKHFQDLGHEKCVVYGEAYGGKIQGMSKTYGKSFKFVAFEVKIDDSWLSVPNAEEVVKSFDLDFVPYVKIPTALEQLDYWRDAPSQQSVKNGITDERQREGIVLRSLIEVRKNNNERVIAKHKGENFQETKTKRQILDPEKLATLTNANEIADEWVTEMRLTHILDKFPNATIEQTGDIVKAMIADIEKEAVREIISSKESKKAIGKQAAKLFTQRLKNLLYK